MYIEIPQCACLISCGIFLQAPDQSRHRLRGTAAAGRQGNNPNGSSTSRCLPFVTPDVFNPNILTILFLMAKRLSTQLGADEKKVFSTSLIAKDCLCSSIADE
jgi:hypothetical protein